MTLVAGIGVVAVTTASKPLLGTENATCRSPEPGPAVEVVVEGLKDRRGTLRLELYPPNDDDFLGDDAQLVRAGKAFRRIDESVPQSGPVSICLRAPAPGRYSLVLLHDRNGDLKFNAFSDGAGFPGNPRLGLSKPKAAAAVADVPEGVITLHIRLNYWRGLSFGPLRHPEG